MKIGAYLTGPFGQSQQLYKVRNEAKRSRGSIEAVDSQILEDTKIIINAQKDASFDFIVDPLFNVFYLFQPFAENVNGVEIGPQENWFNNNVFYWRPQIDGPLTADAGFTANYIHLDILPENSIVVLPSPYTLLELSDVNRHDRRSVIADISQLIRYEAKYLAKKGISRIQYDEPAIAVKQSLGSLEKKDLELLSSAMETCGKIEGVTTSLHTYFGDVGPIITYLIDLPVDCVGIDVTETSIDDIAYNNFDGKELALGLVDSRSPAFEDPIHLIEKLRIVAEKSGPKILWLTPNTGTEYIGWTHGLKKIKILEEAIRSFEND